MRYIRDTFALRLRSFSVLLGFSLRHAGVSRIQAGHFSFHSVYRFGYCWCLQLQNYKNIFSEANEIAVGAASAGASRFRL
jgi:hypothetical protein